MKIKAFYIVIAIILCAFLFASAYSQEGMVKIDNRVFKSPERAPSVFRHDEHNEKAGLDCEDCHHVYDDKGKLVMDETSEAYACADCHSEKGSGNVLPLMKAFHTRCKGCHENEAKGPVTCGECHQWKIGLK